MDKQTDRRTDGKTDRQTYEQTDRETVRQTDGQSKYIGSPNVAYYQCRITGPGYRCDNKKCHQVRRLSKITSDTEKQLIQSTK